MPKRHHHEEDSDEYVERKLRKIEKRLKKYPNIIAAVTNKIVPAALDTVCSGRLTYFYKNWCLITNDQLILSWIKGYCIPFTYPVTQTFVPTTRNFSQSEIIAYQEAIDSLISIGAVSECEPCEGQFLSSYFLIQKSNGKNRFILNLKALNKFIETKHFKIEDLRTTLKLISRGDYMATLDLKDAYFIVSIDPSYRKYLRFKWQQKLLEFNVLPFGLNTSPFVFTKLLKPVMSLLRSSGLMSTIYLDDINCIGRSYDDCKNNVMLSKSILVSLGFIINEQKSCLTPATTCKYLGFIIDSKEFQISLTREKRRKRSRRISRSISSSPTPVSLLLSEHEDGTFEEPVSELTIEDQQLSTPAVNPLVPDKPDETTSTQLDEDILEFLGETPSKEKKYGSKIQDELAVRWELIATSGLPKNIKKELLNKYSTPENCTKVDAPLLNPEIKAALTEFVIKKDKAIETKQVMLATAISCLGNALTAPKTYIDGRTTKRKAFVN